MQNVLSGIGDILIIGDGGFAHEVAEFYKTIHYTGIYSSDKIWFIGPSNEIDFISSMSSDSCLYSTILNGIGNEKRRNILEKFRAITHFTKWETLDLANFNSSEYDMGNIFAPGCIVSTNTKLGKFCIINYNATVGHDCELGDYVTVSPNASIGGWCKLGDECYIGAGANVLPKVKVGKGAIIGAGAVVTKNVPDGVIAKGIPAKWL